MLHLIAIFRALRFLPNIILQIKNRANFSMAIQSFVIILITPSSTPKTRPVISIQVPH